MTRARRNSNLAICGTRDETYDVNGERAKVHEHPEPQSGPARDAWLASRLPYERWVVETAEGRGWAAKRRHVGLHAARLAPGRDNPREVVFADAWRHENEMGDTLRLLTLDGLASFRLPPQEVELRPSPTADEEALVATVMQWLGSACGLAWLVEALDRCGYSVQVKPPLQEKP